MHNSFVLVLGCGLTTMHDSPVSSRGYLRTVQSSHHGGNFLMCDKQTHTLCRRLPHILIHKRSVSTITCAIMLCACMLVPFHTIASSCRCKRAKMKLRTKGWCPQFGLSCMASNPFSEVDLSAFTMARGCRCAYRSHVFARCKHMYIACHNCLRPL